MFESKGERIPPYEQCWVMGSAQALLLVATVAVVERCA
jgi:hypothetical protein